ncbi:MAG: hypothetical protein ACJ75B_06950 [Flavisolibacter sp.]
MGEQIHVLAQQIFGKSSVEECSLQEIRELTQRYPFFAPAQFLLLEKLKQEGSPEYAGQLQKAVLYYHNPLEFEYFISSSHFYTDEQAPNGVAANQMEAQGHEFSTQEINSQDSQLIAEATSHESIVSKPGTEEVLAPQEPLLTMATEEQPNVQHQAKEEQDTSGETVPSATQPQPAQTESNELSFEPFHTVDYFASQGIKLSQEEIPKDRFGKQLKSFTEWLKTMKRLPVQQEVNNLDQSTEKNVAHLAEDSVHDSEVVTEAMAEVWLKQGQSSKALEVYNKLCLLNPSKKAYFAAKIESLKRS